MGCRICLSGDDINPDESAIIILNHRNRYLLLKLLLFYVNNFFKLIFSLDWFFLWAALLHASKPPAHRCKFVLKSE